MRLSFRICMLILMSCSLCAIAQKPGYFQQEVNYRIDVSLNDSLHELKGDIRIEYINHSPATLHEIWMHLWPNAYKDNGTALARQLFENGKTNFQYAPPDQRGYIDALDFKVNGTAAKWEFHPEHIDICRIILNEPLRSGDRITISTPFHVKIPLGIFSRLGHMGQSYQITQWYPKPAVYDHKGWHPMPYLTQGEFYSEFGSFDVSITLPKNYVVGATGDLVDGENELEWLNRKAEETKNKTFFDTKNMRFPASSPEMKTLRYRQQNVHDFAWFADKRWHVLKSEVELPHSKRKVTTWLMFTNHEGHLWKNAVPYIDSSVYYYSLWNGDYPYHQCTAVDGALSAGAGMEYPNVTVIGKSESALALDIVIAHEVGHNWFYGILGSNERDHAWMDEGINSFNENRYVVTRYTPRHSTSDMLRGLGDAASLLGLEHLTHKNLFELSYLLNARRNLDQPINLHSAEYTQINYGGIVYSKTGIAFDYLFAYLGQETFDRCMQTYFERWKFKHPYPEDLQNVFEEVSGKKLDWFFNDIINTTRKIDYKICSAKEKEGATQVKIRNVGQVDGPVSVSGFKNGILVSTQWVENFNGKTSVTLPGTGYEKIMMDAGQDIPEINRFNNTLKRGGLFRKCEPLQIKTLSGLENPYRTQLFWMPVIGWNQTNKVMAGAAFYNSHLPARRTEWVAMPLYSFHLQQITGSGSLGYNWYPSGLFRNIRLKASASSFAFSRIQDPIKNKGLRFFRMVPELGLNFKSRTARSLFSHTAALRYIYVMKEFAVYSALLNEFVKSDLDDQFMEIKYTARHQHRILPWTISGTVQTHEEFVKGWLEGTLRFHYPKKKKGPELRVFAGRFFRETDNPLYHFQMAGKSGAYDYTFDEIYPGRMSTTGTWSKQFMITDGGFKSPYAGNGKTWMIAFNLKVPAPARLPLGFFAGMGWENTYRHTYSEAGFYVPVFRNILEIYFPVLSGTAIHNYWEANNLKWGDRVRFELNLNRLNPFEFLRNFSM